jgi:AcrR family transcriptional regulator
MARWEPQTAERLRTAALELFLEHGYDSVTVAQITERAGLTRRTFSRYFADKRDVLFAGSERLPPALADALLRADRSLPPFAALVRAITEVGEQLPGEAALAAQRRTIVQQSTELRERAGTKFAEATDALAEALRQRDTPAASAALLAEVGTALFRSAFERWTDEPGRASFGEHVRAAAAELAASLSAAKSAEPTP